MFSVVLVVLCVSCIYCVLNKSKPTSMYLNPVSLKTEIVDRYLEIEAMPSGSDKKQAYQQWQQLYSQVKRQDKK